MKIPGPAAAYPAATGAVRRAGTRCATRCAWAPRWPGAPIWTPPTTPTPVPCTPLGGCAASSTGGPEYAWDAQLLREILLEPEERDIAERMIHELVERSCRTATNSALAAELA
ncbi:hypothetical protein GCM10020000_52430 [Streptomyces olivoverticillatus]